MRAYDGIKAERGREVDLEAPDLLGQARQLLSRSIPIQIRMSGGSMHPAIQDGDTVTVEPLATESLRTGEIILYQSRYDTAVIHRVVRIERSSLDPSVITRGDASAQNDPPVPVQRVLGKISHIERAGGRVTLAEPRPRAYRWLDLILARLRGWIRR